MARIAPADWKPIGIDDLEPSAWDALRHEGSACIVAGPGAGKTEFLAQRADYLLSTELCRWPRNILAIAFKRDAARNLALRVAQRSPEGSNRFHSVTFDAFTKGIVDRFRAALPEFWRLRGDYSIQYSTERDVDVFLGGLAAATDEWRADLYAVPRKDFVQAVVGDYLLPCEPPRPSSAAEFAVLEWWKLRYCGADAQKVDFVMLNRLAELIIRSTPQIWRALQATYPFVFVDEFQDTTFAQYSFLRSIFAGRRLAITAVGDNKQRIMGWAGALGDAFHEFQADFHAELFELQWNFRSSDALIEIQHVVGNTLDGSSKRAVSKVDGSVDGNAAEIWRFASEEDEARYIADWICADSIQSGRLPGRYALLARQKASDFEPAFTRELERVGFALRNDDRLVGRVRLQDVLADQLAILLLGLLRLGATDGGNGKVWIAVSDAISQAHEQEQSDAARAAGDRELSQFVKTLRRWMHRHPPTIQATNAVADIVMEFIGVGAVRRSFPTHRAPDAVEITTEAFKIRLGEVADEQLLWDQICDHYEGRDAVPLMTVHKSKGLEYHTVFFLGIDDAQWWSFERDRQESTATFFVGLSRAEQRTVFTYCEARGNRRTVDALYRLLEAGGVRERRV